MRPAPARFPVLRPPPTRLIVAVLLALLVGSVVHRTASTAAARAAALGETTVVAVAVAPLAPGDEIADGAVVLVERDFGRDEPAAHRPLALVAGYARAFAL